MRLIYTVPYHTRQVHALHLDGLCLGDMVVWRFYTDAPRRQCVVVVRLVFLGVFHLIVSLKWCGDGRL